MNLKSYTLNNINIIIKYVLLLFICSCLFPNAIINIIFGISSFAITINLFLYKQKIKIDKNFYFYFILLLYLVINLTFQASYEANNKFWRFMPILSIGLFLFLNIKEYPTKKIAKLSIISCFIYVVICLIKTLIFYTNNSFIPFGNGENINQILYKNRPYVGFYIIINSILLFNEILNNKKYRLVKIVILLLFFSFLLLIVARLSIVSFLLIVLIYLIFYSKISLKNKLMIFSSFILVSVFFICFNPKIKERVIFKSSESFIDNEPRFVIWQSVFNIKDNEDYSYFIGYGNSKLIKDYLVINYDKIIDNPEKKAYFLHDKFDTHSQYFYFLLLGGIPALALFIIYNIYNLIVFRKDFVSFSIFMSFILFMTIENVFSNQLGCYFFLIYITYIHYYHKTLPL